MEGQDSPGGKPLRMSPAAFRARQEVGEAAIILDVRGQRDRNRSNAKIPGALRIFPEIRIDPHWPRDRLTLSY
jgi:hypothetical protein